MTVSGHQGVCLNVRVPLAVTAPPPSAAGFLLTAVGDGLENNTQRRKSSIQIPM